MTGSARNRFAVLVPYVAREWRWLVLIAALTLLSTSVSVLYPLPLKLLVDSALGGGRPASAITTLLGWVSLTPTRSVLIGLAVLLTVAASVSSALLQAALSTAWATAGPRMVHELAANMFRKLERLPLPFHHRQPVGDSLSRLSYDTWTVYSMTANLLVAPVQQVITLVGIGIVAFYLDAQLAVVSLIVAPCMAISTLYFGRPLKRRAQLAREAESRLLSFVHQTLASIPLVQAFSSEPQNRERFGRLASDAIWLSRRGAVLTSGHGLLNGTVTTLATAIVLFIGGSRVLSGALSLGTLLVFLAYMRTLHTAAQGLLTLYGTIKPMEASVDRIVAVLESTDGIPESPNAVPVPDGRAVGHVRLENVTFGYEPERPVLQEITLEALPGQTVAVVGATGAGKSTLVSLIPRFFDPWEGRVTLDGRDVRDLQLASLRSQVALVLQDPFLLPLSIAENIAYGRPSASREEIVAAAVAANAHPFIERLPDGYDAVIGERGMTLSGGERQRLAIARALLKDAPILILDEPTSALDVETEKLLLEALERLMGGRTTFIIAHRLSTVRHADQVVVLEAGRVVEQGSREALLAARGRFFRAASAFDQAMEEARR